ncbi:MAG: hypothetical protein O3A47_01890 [Chloroflexi bacterium]|nr:hypothetical protein [Chloroflexota bacterium]
MAIDPKGVVGPPEFDVCAFLRNNLLTQPEPEIVLARRIDLFADELGFDRQRVAGWGLVEATLSAAWHYEKH